MNEPTVPRPRDSAAILREIQANRQKLDACPKHSFVWEDRLKFGQKLECRNCGGKMDAVQAFTYCQGFAAAGGDPNEVIANFR